MPSEVAQSLPLSLTEYNCPECKKVYRRAFDGKEVHCRACGATLVPKDPPKMSIRRSAGFSD